MTFTDDEVVQILRLLEQSSFDEMQLETGGLKLVARRKGGVFAPEEWERPAAVAVQATETAAVAAPRGAVSDGGNATATAASASPAATGIAEQEEAGLVAITAPNLGTFYRAPKPGAPPFVEVGSRVTEDDTLCLLEVMKCYMTVKAKMRGEVVKICVENAQMVEFGQKLILIRPE